MILREEKYFGRSLLITKCIYLGAFINEECLQNCRQ